MGLSENSVPRKTQWLMIIIPTKWLFHRGYTPFSDIPKWVVISVLSFQSYQMNNDDSIRQMISWSPANQEPTPSGVREGHEGHEGQALWLAESWLRILDQNGPTKTWHEDGLCFLLFRYCIHIDYITTIHLGENVFLHGHAGLWFKSVLNVF